MPYSDQLDIRITDTCLRDGSHAKRHQFTEEHVRSMVAALDAAGMPVILVSAKDDIATKMTSFSAGATRYMAKPIADAELLKELELTFRQVEISKKLKKCNEDGDNEGDFGGAECKLSDD